MGNICKILFVIDPMASLAIVAGAVIVILRNLSPLFSLVCINKVGYRHIRQND